MTIAPDTTASRRCPHCTETLPITEFDAHPKKDRLKAWCRGCCTHHNQLIRAHHQANAQAVADAPDDHLPPPAPLPVWPDGPPAPKSWRHRAACRGEDPELFWPLGNTAAAVLQAEEAKAVCRRCPVAGACLREALDGNQQFGVWGGLGEDERRALKRRISRARATT